MPLISLRPRRAHRPWRTRWSGRSNRSGKAAVLYHRVSRIRPRRDLHDTSGRKFWSNPPKTSRRCALNLHRFGWADFDLHVGVARSPNPSYDNQLAARYGSSRDQYFCFGISAQGDRTNHCDDCGSDDKVCAHGNSPPLQFVIRNLITKAQCSRYDLMGRFAAYMRYGKNLRQIVRARWRKLHMLRTRANKSDLFNRIGEGHKDAPWAPVLVFCRGADSVCAAVDVPIADARCALRT
jgi:hypothetical protein